MPHSNTIRVAILLGILMMPAFVCYAADPPFMSLAGIPGLQDVASMSPNTRLVALLNALYKLAIVVGALAAVFKISVAGFQYLASPSSFTEKGAAIESIKASIAGLLLILATVLIINTIFGSVSLDIFGGAPAAQPPAASSAAPGAEQPAAGNMSAIRPADGCLQFGGSSARGCQASGDTVGVITGTQVQCVNESTLTTSSAANNFSFGPMAVDNSSNAVSCGLQYTPSGGGSAVSGGALIQQGNRILGQNQVPIVTFRQQNGFTTMQTAAALTEYKNRAQAACSALGGTAVFSTSATSWHSICYQSGS